MDSIFSSVIGTEVTVTTYIICLACSMVCGVIAAFAAAFRSRVSKSFLVALVLLPMIVHTVITMVNGNIGTGIAVAGAFSLVRFRSVPGKAREIASIFLSMTAGLTCASGYVAIAVLFTALISVIMLVFSLIPIKREREYELHITVPESLNYYGAFDSVFKE